MADTLTMNIILSVIGMKMNNLMKYRGETHHPVHKLTEIYMCNFFSYSLVRNYVADHRYN